MMRGVLWNGLHDNRQTVCVKKRKRRVRVNCPNRFNVPDWDQCTGMETVYSEQEQCTGMRVHQHPVAENIRSRNNNPPCIPLQSCTSDNRYPCDASLTVSPHTIPPSSPFPPSPPITYLQPSQGRTQR